MLGKLLFGAGVLLPADTAASTKALDALGKLAGREDPTDEGKAAIANALHTLLNVLSSPKACTSCACVIRSRPSPTRDVRERTRS